MEKGPGHFRVFFIGKNLTNISERLNIYVELKNIDPQLDRVFLPKASIVNLGYLSVIHGYIFPKKR